MKKLHFASALLVLAAAAACDTDVTIDNDEPQGPAPRGVIRGTVLYQGPEPCTKDGHVDGNLIVLVFAKNNPPPPAGIAATAVNFTVVTGDTLFPSLPRTTSKTRVCPAPGTKASAGATFAVSPLDAGEYIIQSFFDYTGNFFPTFKFRNLPEKGDIGGGYLDTEDAAKHAGDPSYQPKFFPIRVGVPSDGGAGGLVIPKEGYVADGIAVTVGAELPLYRPYFYPAGAEGGGTPTPGVGEQNPSYVPVVTMTQDQQILAPPAKRAADTAQNFQNAFPQVVLNANLPAAEWTAAKDPNKPFHFQDSPGLALWRTGKEIPEGQGIPALWPLVVFSKLRDDPGHTLDPQSVLAQGSDVDPVVIIQAITLNGDSLFDTFLNAGTIPQTPAAPEALKDHFTALVRPTVICFDPRHVDKGGVLVTPHATGPSADPDEVVPPEGKELADLAGVQKALAGLVSRFAIGCMPTGRYAINLVYPTGQAWTTPNEAGSCAALEGAATLPAGSPLLSCANKPRDVLYSQGTRAVLEIVPPKTPEGVAWCGLHPVPPECIKNAP